MDNRIKNAIKSHLVRNKVFSRDILKLPDIDCILNQYATEINDYSQIDTLFLQKVQMAILIKINCG